MAELVAQINSRLNPVEATCERLGVGRSTVFHLMATGELRSVKVGRRRLVPESAIVEFIARLESAGGGAA